MKTQLLSVKGTWREVADAARTTIGKEAGEGEPSSSWKYRMLLAEHSPIRLIRIKWKWTDILWWVQTHFTRHHVGVEWFVKTSREDRTGVPRAGLTQDALIDMEGDANAQAIINISRKRLCQKASSETRQTWTSFLFEIQKQQPELVRACVPDCVYRGWCYEYKTCGYFRTPIFQVVLQNYREGINARKEE